MKSEKLTEMINKYFTTSASAKTLYGFKENGYIYSVYMTADEIAERCRETVSTGTGKPVIKMNRLTRGQILGYIAGGRATIVCTLETLEQNQKHKHLLNLGQSFEDYIKTMNGLDGYRLGDCVEYFKRGDMELNGEQIQIKFGEACLAEYDLIERAYALKA